MLTIAFGSQSGNARNLAHVVLGEVESAGVSAEVVDMADVIPEEISQYKNLLIVTSTYGDGEPPDNASEWMSYVKFSDDVELPNLRFAVLGLGDTYYPHFCQCAKDFDEYLSKRGGHRLLRRLDCDQNSEEQYADWVRELIEVLKKVDHE